MKKYSNTRTRGKPIALFATVAILALSAVYVTSTGAAPPPADTGQAIIATAAIDTGPPAGSASDLKKNSFEVKFGQPITATVVLITGEYYMIASIEAPKNTGAFVLGTIPAGMKAKNGGGGMTSGGKTLDVAESATTTARG